MKTSLASRVLSPAFQAEVQRIIEPHNHKAHSRGGMVARDCARETRHERERVILQAYAQLNQMGYKLRRPDGLRQKHIEALAKYWEEKGFAARTLHTQMSMLRVFAGWLGKPGLVTDMDQYFERDTHRPTATTVNKAWAAKGIDVDALLGKASLMDERFGALLKLQKAFGLRMKESIELKPLRAVTPSGTHLEVSDGTKGGAATGRAHRHPGTPGSHCFGPGDCRQEPVA